MTESEAGNGESKYPREDVCSRCGAHIGWIISEKGEMFALGICDDCMDAMGDEGEEGGDEEPPAE